MPSSLPNIDATSTILTGSSDGFVRAVKILPTKLLGIVADHGDWPVERLAIGCGMAQLSLEEDDCGDNESGGRVGRNTDEDKESEEIQRHRRGRYWLGSVGHEEMLKMTDLNAFFHESQLGQTESAGGSREQSIVEDDGEHDDKEGMDDEPANPTEALPEAGKEADVDSDSDDSEPKLKKRKRKPEKDPLAVKKKKGKNTVDVEPTFFSGL